MKNQNKPPSLYQLQIWMKWILTDPRGVSAALANPSPAVSENKERYTSPVQSIFPWIQEAPPIDTVARLDIYAEAYFSRILGAMKSDFPITLRVLGDLSFQKLISDYLKLYYSKSPNIGDVGQKLALFSKNYLDLQEASFLPALIEMEWLLIESFYASDTGYLEATKLALLSEQDWETAQFQIASSVHFIESVWPLDQFWRLRDENLSIESIDFQATKKVQTFLLWRERGSVVIERISEARFGMLQKLKSGASLVTTLESAAIQFPDQEIESEVMNAFNEWVQRGLICDLKFANERGAQ